MAKAQPTMTTEVDVPETGESTVSEGATLTPKAGFKFKVTKHVTVPLLKVPDNGEPVYVKITGTIHKAAAIEGGRKDSEGKVQEPPELAQVINLETGEVMQIIFNAVLKKEIEREYPDGAYVNKSFQIRKFKMQTGKRYATFQITEIEAE